MEVPIQRSTAVNIRRLKRSGAEPRLGGSGNDADDARPVTGMAQFADRR
jgi:hypothetical protein